MPMIETGDVNTIRAVLVTLASRPEVPAKDRSAAMCTLSCDLANQAADSLRDAERLLGQCEELLASITVPSAEAEAGAVSLYVATRKRRAWVPA